MDHIRDANPALTIRSPSKDEQARMEFAWANPQAKLTINAGLCLRVALRRLLHIDVVPS